MGSVGFDLPVFALFCNICILDDQKYRFKHTITYQLPKEDQKARER